MEDDSQVPCNDTRVKSTIADVLRDDSGVVEATLDAHGELHAHVMEQSRRQATEEIGKIDEELAENNVRDIVVRVKNISDVLEAVAEALRKTPTFKTRIKTIALVIYLHQAKKQGLIAYTM